MTLALASAGFVTIFAILAFRFKARGVRYSFLVFCLALIVYLYCGHLVESGRATVGVYRALYFAANPAIVALAIFIGRLDGVAVYRPRFWIFPAVAVVTGFLILTTDLVIAGMENLRPQFGFLGPIFFISIGGNLAQCVWVLRNARRRAIGLQKFQLTGTLVALSVAGPLTLITNVVLPLFFGVGVLSAYGAPIAAMLWVTILAFTVLHAQKRAAAADPRSDFIRIPAAHYEGLLETCRLYRVENHRLESEIGRLQAEALDSSAKDSMSPGPEALIALDRMFERQPALRSLLQSAKPQTAIYEVLGIMNELIARGVAPEEVLSRLKLLNEGESSD